MVYIKSVFLNVGKSIRNKEIKSLGYRTLSLISAKSTFIIMV